MNAVEAIKNIRKIENMKKVLKAHNPRDRDPIKNCVKRIKEILSGENS